LAVNDPVIRQSALEPSLLLTATIRQARATPASHASVTSGDTVTGTILSFGGHSRFGLAVTAAITGAVVSSTLTVPMHVLESPAASVAVRVTPVVPSPYGPAGDCPMVTASRGIGRAVVDRGCGRAQVGARRYRDVRQRASGGWFTAAERGASPSGRPPGPAAKVVQPSSGTWPTPGLLQSQTPVGNVASSRACWSRLNATPP